MSPKIEVTIWLSEPTVFEIISIKPWNIDLMHWFSIYLLYLFHSHVRWILEHKRKYVSWFYRDMFLHFDMDSRDIRQLKRIISGDRIFYNLKLPFPFKIWKMIEWKKYLTTVIPGLRTFSMCIWAWIHKGTRQTRITINFKIGT